MWRVAYILSASYVLVCFFFINIRRLDFILQLTVDALVVVVVVGCCCNSACVCIRNCWFMVFQLKNQQFSLVLFCFSFFNLLYALTNKSSLKIDRPLPGACFFYVFFFFWLLISEAGGIPPFWLGFLPGRAGWVTCFLFCFFSTTLSRQRGNLVKSPRLDTALFGRKKEAWTPRRRVFREAWKRSSLWEMENEKTRERKGKGEEEQRRKTTKLCEKKNNSTGKEREQKRGNREVETKEERDRVWVRGEENGTYINTREGIKTIFKTTFILF